MEDVKAIVLVPGLLIVKILSPEDGTIFRKVAVIESHVDSPFRPAMSIVADVRFTRAIIFDNKEHLLLQQCDVVGFVSD